MKKKKSLKKKLIIIGIVAAIVLIAFVVIVMISRNSRRAYVQPVSELNMTGMAAAQTYQGKVAESAQQKEIVGSDKKVADVFVEKGDSVKKGDKLFRYDTRLLELTVEEKQLAVDISETSLSDQKKQLEFYQSIVPVAETEAPPETEAPTEKETVAAATEPAEEAAGEEASDEEPQETKQKTYTAQEKADLITNQQLEVSRAQTHLEAAEEDLAEAKAALDKAVVTAKLDGTVENIQDPESIDATAPFCTVIGNTGVTVKGYIGEFDRQNLHIGDSVNVSSFMTNASSTAEVLTVSDYPTDSSANLEPSGNKNSSFYEFTAFMDHSEGFDIGSDVEISMVPKDEEEQNANIVLSKAYVRTDSDGSYVLKDVEGKLVRQNIKVKKTNQSELLLVTDGLEPEDKIAFPYGSKGKEGLLTTTEPPAQSIF